MELLIPCAFSLEAIVKRQLLNLGHPEAKADGLGKVAVSGDWSDVAKLNVFLRSGERVLIKLSSFRAETFDELFEGAYSVPWEDWMTLHTKILIDGKAQKSKLGAIKASGGVVKKAIVKRLVEKLHSRSPRLDESGERMTVGVSIYQDEVTLSVDTSGEGLHKRGYRTLAYSAPLKETVAAALIDMTYYQPEKPFADLFCGSGTIPIEAAMRSMHIAPGLKRSFDFTEWKNAPKSVLPLAKEEARDLIVRRPLEIFGGDINPQAIKIAKFHAREAGVADQIRFCVADVKDFTSSDPYGILLSNPPYGERLSDVEEARELTKLFGKVYRSLPNWSCYLFSGLEQADRYFGKRADRYKKLYNANIECGFYSFLGAPPPKQTQTEACQSDASLKQ
ncbi:MAG: class I SAM-dependent RNA methyltransferase [Christensenellaceae bacterium]